MNGMPQVWKRVTDLNRTDPRVFLVDYPYHLREVKKGKYAVILFDFHSDIYKANDCKLTTLGEKLLFDQMAFGLPKASPLKPEFEPVYVSLAIWGGGVA